MKWLKDFFVGPVDFERLEYPLAYEGSPPDDLTWSMAWNDPRFSHGDHIIPMTLQSLPKICPTCGDNLVEKKFDRWCIEDSENHDCGEARRYQYMVHTVECPNGHGWAMDVA